MKLRTIAWLLALAWLLFARAPAWGQHRHSSREINAKLCGTLLDYTQNSGHDCRIYSQALCRCRDLYVYLPPGYDPKGCYPLLLWLHSYTDDECEFGKRIVPLLDQAIVNGELPPLIVAAPDGSLSGNYHFLALGSWYVNSRRGRFADYIIEDVLGFVERNFAVCRDRSGRAIGGFSMGGFGAYSLGMKNADKFKYIVGISPALNLRYGMPNSGYLADFVPGMAYLREEFSGKEVVGEFYGGLLKVRAWQVVRPVFGRGRSAVEQASQVNPIELLDRLNIQPGQLEFFVAYGQQDELNVDAQVESFLHTAAQRGIEVHTKAFPCGDHSIPFMIGTLPDMFAFLNTHLRCPDCPAAP